jgi:hypothetical protein
MTHKLLVTTYQDDLTQFEMFCHCLNKNWQSNRQLTVALGKNTNVLEVQRIIDQALSQWTVDIQSTIHSYSSGYTEQQVNKIFHSMDSTVDDVIVFDSKDFLLRSCNIDNFKQNNQYRATFYIPGQRLVELYPDIEHIVDQDVSQLPSVINLTPWIWKVDQLNRYWNYINQRFGNYQSWNEFPAGTEIYGFYVYTWCDKQSTMQWQDPDTPLLIGGGWTHQTYDGMLAEAQAFDQWTERKIWKHSRKLEDSRCLDVTKSVLLKYGIEQEIIDRVFCYEEPGKP